MVHYIGNQLYCYADSIAMVLADIGENISSSQIEVLTGVGLGAFWIKDAKLIFFSNTPPDIGVSQALELLGFEYTEKSRQEAEPVPLDELRAVLAKSPAVLGPLDMGYLSYLPRDGAGLADHFVLAYALDESEIHLHDPLGFPHVSLPLDQLGLAWKAERISYRRGHYRYWTSPRRVHRPAQEEVYDRALQYFKSCYQHADDLASRENWMVVGRDAILTCVDHVRGGKITPQEKGFMTNFPFQLGARRALDFAVFFDFRDADLAALKRRQAKLFGRCHVLAVREDWTSLADTLQQLADVESEFRAALCVAVGKGENDGR